MSRKLEKLQSKKRVSGTPYDFIFKASDPLVGTYTLKSLVLNNSFFNINSSNNIIYFSENGSNKTCTLTAGFYNATNIASALQTALTTASGGYAGYTVTYTATSGKLTVSSTQNFSFTFATNTTNSLGPLLGFNTDTTAGTTQVADSIMNLNPILSFNIDIDSHLNVMDMGGYSGSTFVIPNSVNSTDFVIYEPNMGFEQSIVFSQSVSQIRVRVLDDSNQTIPLAVDWYMILAKC
jgi:hypothetical protein